ncbi:ABC transporter ATP-binding protein [Roseomonas sp. BN140053]|uniref:ABC transporter ATP-binding protein n=1 Tax=Roseomonas sp. BN140053 TaxID=3391898 RepID=UPI0039E9735E
MTVSAGANTLAGMAVPPDTGLVRFESVEKSYGASAVAVRDLHLTVERGELLSLLGPSGSGKTTTLMMLAGFEQPTRGRILLEGRDIARTPPHRRGIGVVFQSYALFPHMSVADNIAFPLEVRGVSRREREGRARRALDMVRLAGFGDRRPSQLSGGQQQRVALARALVFEPPIVLLDEPLGALDKNLREEMQFEIRRLHRELGVTMLYVTHDQGEALTLSDRVAVFRAGRIRQLAAPRQLYERPADSFVAGFVGENNRLPGTVLRLDEGECRVRLDAGAEVFATAAAGVAAGGRCVVMVRPERVAVAPVAAEDLGEDALPARLIEAIFQGDHIRLRLSLGSGEVVAKRPAGGGALPEPGGPAALAWDVGHGIAFLEEDAGV